ncbi:fumarylacetoacetate hydrolase family protein [Cobetia amphilecti]|uniref:fumarylacetoacetate hydrolase family protein n=1 Tax=Cobetia amphilecti TaxID=1055104 RepID=UPI0025517522|nr:fumarylacetoacetate hydrolase family protein [Cobetia amphilecti]
MPLAQRFTPRFSDGRVFAHDLGKVVCVGRNYAAHAAELGNEVPSEPLLFIKPATSVTPMDKPLAISRRRGQYHYEAELALLIGKPLCEASEAEALEALAGMGLALDLTLRERQSKLKTKGQPWELAKAFDGSCPLSSFVALEGPRWRDADGELHSVDFQALHYRFAIDGEQRQQADTSLMLFPVARLLSEISHSFTLLPGDVVLTGTPEGVGELNPDQALALALDAPDGSGELLRVETRTRGVA